MGRCTAQWQRWVLISGHSDGLGRALAEHYLAAGWQVWGWSRRSWTHAETGLRQTCIDLTDATAVITLTDSADWHATLASADEVLLINNAASVLPCAVGGRQLAAQIAAAVSLNIMAPMLLTNALLRTAAGGCLKTVVHISSGAGRQAYPGWSVYGATKAALDHHARALAAENHPLLRVASIAPGVIDTAMQTAIRCSHVADFPMRPRFDDLHAQQRLSSARNTAVRLAALIDALTPGDPVCLDVREPPCRNVAASPP